MRRLPELGPFQLSCEVIARKAEGFGFGSGCRQGEKRTGVMMSGSQKFNAVSIQWCVSFPLCCVFNLNVTTQGTIVDRSVLLGEGGGQVNFWLIPPLPKEGYTCAMNSNVFLSRYLVLLI